MTHTRVNPMARDRTFHSRPADTMRKLRAVLDDEYCQRVRMNMSSVRGFLGELLVGSLLVAAGYDVEHLGGQHGSDLVVRKLGAEIDVKTSALKMELGCPHWGWALLSGSKTKDLTFTHIVCVALDASHKPASLFVVKVGDLEQFPAGIPPFVKNKRVLFITQDGNVEAGVTQAQKTAVSLCGELVRGGALHRATDGDSLAALLRST